MKKALRFGLEAGAVIATLTAAAATALLAVAFLPTVVGFQSSVVTSGSMGRTAPVGSVALTRMVDSRSLRPGDVVSFRRPGRQIPVTHRIVEIADRPEGRFLSTKGDANPSPDAEPVHVTGRIARVEHVVPVAGYLVQAAHTPAGWMLLIVVPIVGLLRERRRSVRRPAARITTGARWNRSHGTAA